MSSVRRRFLWGAQVLDDPDPGMTPEQVRDYYAEMWPELTTAAVEIKDEASGEVTFAKQVPATVGGGARQTVTFKPNQGKRG